jgi:multiple sugar transport system permease protein
MAVNETTPERWNSHKLQKQLFVLSILIPMGLVFGVFWVYPMADGFWGSLHDWSAFAGNAPREFIGLGNYEKLFADDLFWMSVVNSFEYALYYLPASIVLALLLAMAVNSAGRLTSFFRTVYFLPVVTSVVATALIFNYLYQPRFGLLNQLLSMAGLGQLSFLSSPRSALPSIAAYAVWKNLGFNMVLFMAGLSSIPRMYYDAAHVDGANHWQTFTRITLPLLRPTTVFVVITGVIETLQVFRPIYVMTSRTAADAPGGPLNSTTVIALYQWRTAFEFGDLGYGAAMGIALFVLVLLVTLVQILILGGRLDVNRG